MTPEQTLALEVAKTASISEDGKYRFSLTRYVEPIGEDSTVTFILNNPSTADANKDDPTVRRCWNFARSWGYNRMEFVNVNPFRSTDPSKAIIPPEEILQINDTHIRIRQEDFIICAWGAKANKSLVDRVLRILLYEELYAAELHYLELTKDGIPKHPLYLKSNLYPQIWNPFRSTN